MAVRGSWLAAPIRPTFAKSNHVEGAGLGSPFAKSNHVAGGGACSASSNFCSRGREGSVCPESQ